MGQTLHANGVINGPCVYNTTTCTQIAPTKGVCEDNNGIWWGAGATDPSTAGIPPEGLALCCDVAIWQADHSETISSNIYPLYAVAMRNTRYKLVVNNYQSYDAATNGCAAATSTEFYQINQKAPIPKLDTAEADLLASGVRLNPEQQKNYNTLSAQLKTLLASQPACAVDISLDGTVDYEDIAEWGNYEELALGNSSWADVNQDGLTNDADLAIILQSQGACPNP